MDDYFMILLHNSATEVLPNLVHLGRLRQEADHVSLWLKDAQAHPSRTVILVSVNFDIC